MNHDIEEAGLANLILVEDDERMGALLTRFLSDQDHAVHWEKDGPTGLKAMLSKQPDLVILDLMLPGFDGLEVCRRARPTYGGPILMLTAVDDEFSEISALDLGIEDYLTKPFRARVLAARIRAILKRHQGSEETKDSDSLEVGRLRILANQREVYLDGETVEVTESEFELLHLLAQNVGEVIPRHQMYTALKGSDYHGFDRAIDMRISTLRKKLNDHKAPYQFIKTIRGKGYMLGGDN